ncbi:MAG: alpha/beta hydrolase [Thermoproteota archaeon]
MSDYSPVALPGSETRILKSSIVNDTYRLNVVLPTGYNQSDDCYPVVYAADGNRSVFTISQVASMLATSGELPPLIVVGVGYPTDDPAEIFVRRTRDYNPPSDEAHDRRYMEQFHLDSIETGGTEEFLRFIREELKPFMNTNYRTDPHDAAYVGHSGGGTFGLYALFSHPETFNRYVIGSPTIFRGDNALLSYEQDYAENHDDLPATVFLSAGEREEIDDPLLLMFDADPEELKLVTNVKILTRSLQKRNYPKLHLTCHIFKDETHLSVIPTTYSRGLRDVFKSSNS